MTLERQDAKRTAAPHAESRVRGRGPWAVGRSSIDLSSSFLGLPVRIRLLFPVLLLVAFSAPLAAQNRSATPAYRPVWPDETGPLKWAPRPTVPAITANDLRTRLYQFADDSMQGRKVGELGDYKATAYVAREFKRLGLKPAGEDGGYFQEIDYGPVGFDIATARLGAGGSALAARTEWYPSAPTATNGVAADADVHGAVTVFAGALDDSTPLDPATYRGKVAVFTAPAGFGGGRGGFRGGRAGGATPAANACNQSAGFPAPRGAAYAIEQAAAAGGGRGGARGGRGGRGGGGSESAALARASSAGAVAVLLIEDGFSAAAGDAAFNQRGAMRPTLPSGGVPTATISSAAAAAIFGKAAGDLTPGTTGKPVDAAWSYSWHKSQYPGRNVIAILPGSNPKLAGEFVLVSAHNDHNGIVAPVDHDSLRAYNTVMRPQGANDRPSCPPTALQQHLIDSMIAHARSIRPPRRDSIQNGADDDGSGTVVLLEIAEKFATEHPQRSIIFVSHTGEEAGLLGSKWFTDHPTIPLDSVAAAFNMDMVGKGRVTDVAFGGRNSVQTLGSRRESTQFGDIIDSVNAISPEPMVIDRTWDVPANPLNRFCRSDQVNYVHHEVPVTYFSLGYAKDYHQVTDEPQYIDYDHAAKLGRWIHELMTAVANRPDRPAKDGPNPNYPTCN